MPKYPASTLPIVEIITISIEGPNEFTVKNGERYHSRMTWEEMLGQIAELTHPKIDRPRFDMLTDDEWATRYPPAFLGGHNG